MTNVFSPFENHTTPFLKMLGNVGDLSEGPFWFETFDDKKGDRNLHRWFHQPIGGALEKLRTLNRDGAAVFIGVNQNDGQKRLKVSVCGLRAWFVDIDFDKATERLEYAKLSKLLPLPPSMWVETPGGYHLYWLMADAPLKCDDASRLTYEKDLKLAQSALAKYGADKACTDSNRLLRVPGFFHNKSHPQMVYFHDCGGRRYTRDEFRAAFRSMSAEAEQADLKPPPKGGDNGQAKHKPPRVSKPIDKETVLKRAIGYLQKCPPAIQGQNGSGTCFTIALKIQDGFDLSQDEAFSLLWEHYNPRCVPPWSEKELRHKVEDAASKCTDRGHLIRRSHESKPKAPTKPSDTQEDEPAEQGMSIGAQSKRRSGIMRWAISNLELFSNGVEAFASTVEDCQRTYRIDSESFEEWVTAHLYNTFGAVLSLGEKAEIISTLRAKAKYSSQVMSVFTRIGRDGGNVYLDLCDPGWRQVAVTNDGWRVIEAKDSPVRFQRFPGMAELPTPARNGSIDTLRHFLHVNDPHYKLCVTWLVQALYGGTVFPVLVINGSQGTGKTTASRTLRSLIDPSDVPDNSPPRNETDAMLSASKSWVLAWDNLSNITNHLSDLTCRLATGAGFRTRRLYTGNEEHLVSIARPVIMNGIPDLLKREDLADRALSIRLLPIGNTRKTESDYWREFREARPGILGGLLDVLAGAIGELPYIRMDGASKPRMMDFARLGMAVEKVCGWQRDSSVKAYEETRTDAAHSVLDESTVAQTLIVLSKEPGSNRAFAASEIRKILLEIAKQEGLDTSDKAFFNDRVFKSATERVNPALFRCHGFFVKWRRTAARNEYVFKWQVAKEKAANEAPANQPS